MQSMWRVKLPGYNEIQPVPLGWILYLLFSGITLPIKRVYYTSPEMGIINLSEQVECRQSL